MKRYPFHFFLATTFPALFLFAHNLNYASSREFFELFFILLSLSTLATLALRFRGKVKPHHYTVATLSVVSLYLYGPLNLMLGGVVEEGIGLSLVIFDYLLAFSLVGAVVLSARWLAQKTAESSQGVTFFLNVSTLVLFSASLAQLIEYSLEKAPSVQIEQLSTDLIQKEPQTLPDIYYIILDGYARGDILENLYQFDNSEFVSELEALGFAVLQQSSTNYPQTSLSLASSLNLNYLSALLPSTPKDYFRLQPLFHLIHRSAVASFLRENGYTFISYTNGWNSTESIDADVLLGPAGDNKLLTLFLGNLNLPFLREYIAKYQHDVYRDKQRFILQQLGDEPTFETPKFVFAHIISPHPPFVFQRDGSPKFPGRAFSMEDGKPYGPLVHYRENYLEQLRYVNKKIAQAVKRIIRAKKDSVIILQADHGPGSRYHMANKDEAFLPERFSILNAFYFRGSELPGLYDTLSPVNSFRLVFNHLFELELDVLPDKSFYASYLRPYHFIELNEDERSLSVKVE